MKNSIDQLRQETMEQFVLLHQALNAKLPMQHDNALVTAAKERDDLQKLSQAKEQEYTRLRERLQTLEQTLKQNNPGGQTDAGDTSLRIVTATEPDAEKIVLQSIDASCSILSV
jgi:hypothetical protein